MANVSFYLSAILALCVKYHSFQERNVPGNVLILHHHVKKKKNIYIYIYSLASEYIGQLEKLYCQTQKTMATRKISGMLTVYWPITIKLRICKQTSKPLTNCHCSLWFSYLSPYWLISHNTIINIP